MMSEQTEEDVDALDMDDELTFDDSDIEIVLDYKAEDDILVEDILTSGDSFDGQTEVVQSEDPPLACGQLEDGEQIDKHSEEETQKWPENAESVEKQNDKDQRFPHQTENLAVKETQEGDMTSQSHGCISDTKSLVKDDLASGTYIVDNQQKELDIIEDEIIQNKNLHKEFDTIIRSGITHFPQKESVETVEVVELDSAGLDSYSIDTDMNLIHKPSNIMPATSSELDYHEEIGQSEEILEGEGNFDEVSARLSESYSQSANDADKIAIQEGFGEEPTDAIDSEGGEPVQVLDHIGDCISTHDLQLESEDLNEITEDIVDGNKYVNNRLTQESSANFNPRQKSCNQTSNKEEFLENVNSDVNLQAHPPQEDNRKCMDVGLIVGHHTTGSLTQIASDVVVTEKFYPSDPCGDMDQIVQSDGEVFQHTERNGGRSTTKNVNNNIADTVIKQAQDSTHAHLSAGGLGQVKSEFASDKNTASDKSEQVAQGDGFLTARRGISLVQKEERSLEEALLKKNSCFSEKVSCLLEDLGIEEKHLSNPQVAISNLKTEEAQTVPSNVVDTASVESEKVGKVNKKHGSNTTINRKTVRDEKDWSFGREPVLVADIVAHRLSQSLTYDDSEELNSVISDEDINELADDSIFDEHVTAINADGYNVKTSHKATAKTFVDESKSSETSLGHSCDNINVSRGEDDNSSRCGLEVHSGDVIVQKRKQCETRDITTPSIIESSEQDTPVQGSTGHKDIPDDNREGIIVQLSGNVAAAEDIIKELDQSKVVDQRELCSEKVREGKQSEKSVECGKRVSCSPSRIETSLINDSREAREFVVGDEGGPQCSLSQESTGEPEYVYRREIKRESYKKKQQQQLVEQGSVCSNIYQDSVCFDENPDQTGPVEGITHHHSLNEQQGEGASFMYTGAFQKSDTHSAGQIVCEYTKSSSDRLSCNDNNREHSSSCGESLGKATDSTLVQTVQQFLDKSDNKTKQETYSDELKTKSSSHLKNQCRDQDLISATEKRTKQSQMSGRKSTESSSSCKQAGNWNISMAEDEDFEVIDYEQEDVTLPRVRQAAHSSESLSAEGGEWSNDAALKNEPLLRSDDEQDDHGFEILHFDNSFVSSGSRDEKPSKTIDQGFGEGLRSEALSPRSKYLETNLDSDFSVRSVGFKTVHHSSDSLKGDISARMDEPIHNQAVSGEKVGVKKLAGSSSGIHDKAENLSLGREASKQGKKSADTGARDDGDFDSDVSEARQLISEIYGETFKVRRREDDKKKNLADVYLKHSVCKEKQTADQNIKRDSCNSVEKSNKSNNVKSFSTPEVFGQNRGKVSETLGNVAETENQKVPFVVEQYTIGKSYVHSETVKGAEMVTVDNTEGEIDTQDTKEISEGEDAEVHLESMDRHSSNEQMSRDNPFKNVVSPSQQVLTPTEDNTMASEMVLREPNKHEYYSGDSYQSSVASPIKDNVFSSPDENTEDREASHLQKEERQQRGRPRERRTVRNVKEAMRKLKGESSSNKERPHSYHGDEGEEVRSRSNSRRRYDWNTTHFFPDIHDEDIRPLDKRSDRASQYSLYLEEDWIRDQYYSPQENKKGKQNRISDQYYSPQKNNKDKSSDQINQEMDFSTDNTHQLTDHTWPHLNKENHPPGEQNSYYTTSTNVPSGELQKNHKRMDVSSSQEELEMMNVRPEVDTCESSSSDPGDRESPKVWKKSPLHLNKKKRKDRPLSQEVHLNGDTSGDPPIGAIPISRMGVKMGSPGSRVENTTKNLRGNRRSNAPNMGTKVTPKKAGSTGAGGTGGGSDIQQKYAKFEELQKRRRALESTSEESLVIPKPGSSIQDSLRRYHNKHRHPRHPDKVVASRKLFQSEEAIHEKSNSTQESNKMTRNPGSEEGPKKYPSISGLIMQDRQGTVSQTSLHSSGNEDSTNNFLVEMKKKLKSVRKSQEDLRYERTVRGEAEGAREIIMDKVNTSGVQKGATMSPYKTASTSVSQTPQSPSQKPRGSSLKSQLDHISTETVSHTHLTNTQFHQDAISQRSIPEKHRTLSSSFENIYDGLNNTEPFSSGNSLSRDWSRPIANGTESPEKFKHQEVDYQVHQNFRSGPSHHHEQLHKQQYSVSKETNPRGSQGSLEGSRSHSERRSSGDSRTTPTSVTSEGQSSRKMDAKSLVMEERKKFEVYKREYVRRMSSKESTSGDETKDSYSDTSPRHHQPMVNFTPSEPRAGPTQRPDIPPDEYDYILRKIHHTRQNATVLEKSERAQKVEEANAALSDIQPYTIGDQTIKQESQHRSTDSHWQDSESYLQQQKQKLQQRKIEAQLQRESTGNTQQPKNQQTDASHTQQYVDVVRQFSFNEDDNPIQSQVSDNRAATTGDNKGNYKEKSGHHLYSKSMSAIDSDAVFDQQDNYHKGYQGSHQDRVQLQQGVDYRDNRQTKDMRDLEEQQQQWYPEARPHEGQPNYQRGRYDTYGEEYYDSMPKGRQKERFPRGDYSRHSYHEGFNNTRPVHQKSSKHLEEQLRQEDYISKPHESIIADFSESSSARMPRDDYYSYKRKPEPNYNRDKEKHYYHQQQPPYPNQTDAYYQSHDRRPRGSGDIKPYHEKSKKHGHGGQHGSLPDFRHRKDLLKSWSETHIEQRGNEGYNWDQYNYKPEKYQRSAKDYLHDHRMPTTNLEYSTQKQQKEAVDGRSYPRQPVKNNYYDQMNDGYPQHKSSQGTQQREKTRNQDQYYRDGYQKQHLEHPPPVPQQDPYYRGDGYYPDISQRPVTQGGDKYPNEQWRNQAPPKPARYQQQLTASSHSNPLYDHTHDNSKPTTYQHSGNQYAYDTQMATATSDQKQASPAYQYTKINVDPPSQPNYPQRDRVDDVRERSFQVAYSPNHWSPRPGENFQGGDRDRYVREYVPVENSTDNNATVGPNASVHVDSYFKPVNPNTSFSQYSDATGSTASHMQQHQPTPQDHHQYYPAGQEEVKENTYQARYQNRSAESFYQQYQSANESASNELQQLEEETFSASREHKKCSKERDHDRKPVKLGQTLPQQMREEETYSEEFPPPPPPVVEELVDFPQQDQEVFTQELNNKLCFLKDTDPRFRDYDDKVSQYIREHKSQASNQYEVHIQQERDSYRAKHQAQIQDKEDYVDPKTIRQRKEGFEELYKNKLLRSRSLPRESGARGREASPAGRGAPVRDTRRGREGRPDKPTTQKEETVFQRKAKFTQSFRQSPDKTTEKQSSEADKKRTSQFSSTRHVLRPSRSAENLYQASSEDMPKISVLQIKERLFGQRIDQKVRKSPPKVESDLSKVLERKDRKVDSVKDVFSKKEEKLPIYSTSYKSNSGIIDAEQDELLYNVVSCRDNQERRNINIFDDLTDLEITYARVKRENNEAIPGSDPSHMAHEDYNPTEPSVKRLSISNVRKFEELLQRRQDSSPKEEYTKQWIKKEQPEGTNDRVPTGSVNNKKHMTSQSTDDGASVATSDDRRFSGRLSLPRKKADDMAYRKTHQLPASNSMTLQSLNIVGSYLPQPGKTISLELVTKGSSASPLNRKSRSPEKETRAQLEVTGGKMEDFRNRDRISMKDARSKFISGDNDVQSQDTRPQKSAGREITVSIRKRAKSLDRNALGKQESKSSLERSNSFGRGTDPKNLSTGVATMVMLFTSPKEMSQSTPDLAKASVFAGHYNSGGDLVSDDPKYRHAIKPKKLPSSTPRMIKMRNEMKSKMKGMKSSGDSGFYQEDESDSYSSSDQFHRQPPDGALCDSDEFDLAKVSDGSSERGKGLQGLRAKFEVQKDTGTKKTGATDSNSNNNNNGLHGYSRTPPSPTMKTEMKVELTPPPTRKINIAAETKIAKENFLNMDQEKRYPERPSHIDLQNIKLRKVSPVEGVKHDLNQSKTRDQGSSYAAQISQLQYIDSVIASSMSGSSSSDQVDKGKRNREPDEVKPKFEFKREMLRKKDASPERTSKVSLVKPKAYPFGMSEDMVQKSDDQVLNVSKKTMPVEITHSGLKAPCLDDIGSKFDKELKAAKAKLSGKISPNVLKESEKRDGKESRKDPQASTFEIQFSNPSIAKESKPAITQISRASTSSVTSSQDSPRIINITLSRNSSREGDISQTESEASPSVKIERISREDSRSQVAGKPQFSWSDSKTKEKITPKPCGESRLKEIREARGFKEEKENYSKEVSQIRVVKQKTTVHRETVAEPRRFGGHPLSIDRESEGSIDKYGVTPMSPGDLSDGEMTDATDITLDSMVRANLPSANFDSFGGFKAKREADASSVSSENSQKEYLISEGLERRPAAVRFVNPEKSSCHGDKTGASIMSHKRSTKSESSITTETSQSGTRTVEKEVHSSQSHYKREVKKDLRDERRLSLKERVQLFEDQAEPFMRKSKTHENI